jgi:hypothetical protein
MKKTLFIIPCCKRKVEGGAPLAIGGTYFDNPAISAPLIAKRALKGTLIGYPVGWNLAGEELKIAWDRYDGLLYRRLKEHQILITHLIQMGSLDIIIISALYGVINYNTPIVNYDLEMKGNVAFWNAPAGNVISTAVTNYCNANNINIIHTFLTPTTYLMAATGGGLFPAHINHWPVRLRGVNNIYNRVADMAIEILLNL